MLESLCERFRIMLKNVPKRKISPSLFLLFLTLLFFPFLFRTLEALTKNTVWKEEGVIFDDPTIHNIAIAPLLDGRYRIYFDQENRIKSALSKDGRELQVEEGERLEGSMSSIIKLPDGRWRIYFSTSEGEKSVFKSVISSDGLTWTTEDGTRLTPGGEYDPDDILNPSVITLSEGGYRMFYDGEVRHTVDDFSWRILSATSPNGLTWTKDQGVRINLEEAPLYANLVWNAHAEYDPEEKIYRLYFTVKTTHEERPNGIYSATSEDGLSFTVSGEPEMESKDENIEAKLGNYQEPFVFNFPEGKRIYYWKSESGIYSSLLTEEPSSQEESRTSLWGRLLSRLGLKETTLLPKNLELYIVPTLLLVAVGAILRIFWRSRHRR